MSLKNVINADNLAITLKLLSKALVNSGCWEALHVYPALYWEVPIAQLLALEDLYMYNMPNVTIVKETKINFEIPKKKYFTNTLMGIEIKVNNDGPQNLIRLMQGDNEIVRIENLRVLYP